MKKDLNEMTFEEVEEFLANEPFEETLLTSDLTGAGGSLIPYLIHATISIGLGRKSVFMQAVQQTDQLLGVEGNEVRVAVLGRDEFTARKISEAALDNNGYTKDELSPESVKITLGDIVYNATKISDVLLEDSPKLGWIQASLMKMSQAIAYEIDIQIRDKLIEAAGTTRAAETVGTLKYQDIIKLKTSMEKKGVDFGLGAVLFLHPDQKEDLVLVFGQAVSGTGVYTPLERYTTDDPTIPAEVGKYAGLTLVVSDTVPAGTAILVAKAEATRGPAAMLAWKRTLKSESWRGSEAQYGRSVFLVSCRFGVEVIQSSLVGTITSC